MSDEDAWICDLPSKTGAHCLLVPISPLTLPSHAQLYWIDFNALFSFYLTKFSLLIKMIYNSQPQMFSLTNKITIMHNGGINYKIYNTIYWENYKTSIKTKCNSFLLSREIIQTETLYKFYIRMLYKLKKIYSWKLCFMSQYVHT